MYQNHRPVQGTSHPPQTFARLHNGSTQFDTDNWENNYSASSGSYNLGLESGTGQYALDIYSKEQRNDPFVAAGIFSTNKDLLGNQQAPHGRIIQHQQFFQENDQQPADGSPVHDDSGYGDSRHSCSVTSPSVKAGETETVPELRCPQCDDFVGKNRSDLKKHIRRHVRPCICPVMNCTRRFATHNDLDRHIKSLHWEHYVGSGNCPVYSCSLCEDKGRKARRGENKTEWVRKDNFLSHMSRVHSINIKSADELAQYVVPAQRQPSNISNMTAEAQQKDLYGVGTSPDFVNPQPDMAYAKEITNLPHNQADDPPTQRYDMIHSDVLASTNVFRSPMEQTFIDPELLGHENIDVATGPSLHGKQDTGMQDNFVNSTGSLTQASQAHRIGEDILHQPHVSNKTGTYEFAMDLDDTEEYVSNPLELSNSTGEMTGASQQEVTASSSQHVNTNQSSAPYSLAIAQPSPSNSQEVVKWLGKNHPEILQAALNARPPGGDDGSTAETNSTPKALNHQCRDCQKLFKRPCELTKHRKRHSKPYGCTWPNCNKTFGSKNDWKRHEDNQHYIMEVWVCDVKGCQRKWNRREKFKSHLESHKIDSDSLDKKVEQCRQGKHCDPRFWCGFCDKYIKVDLSSGNANSWSKRCDHIDAHFCGRDQLPQQSIENWKHEPRDHVTLQTSSGETLSSFDSTQQTMQNTPTQYKRKAYQMDFERSPPKRLTTAQVVEMWNCCQCSQFMNVKTSPACIHCQHRQCGGCTVASEIIPHEDLCGNDSRGVEMADEHDLAIGAG